MADAFKWKLSEKKNFEHQLNQEIRSAAIPADQN
jgi:hypothetical protein